jgi:hypothetical protein
LHEGCYRVRNPEFEITSILRFKNLKSIELIGFIIKPIQLVPFANLSKLKFIDIEIHAKSLDIIFVHSKFITDLNLNCINITNGYLNFNNSFQNLRSVILQNRWVVMNPNNINSIIKAIGGSANTLTFLLIGFLYHEHIDSNLEILKRLTNLQHLDCTIKKVFACSI